MTDKGFEIDPEIKKALKIMEMAGKIEEYINGLTGVGPISNEILATAEKEWRNKSVDQLLYTAENSNERQWSKYPGTYLELARALRKKAFKETDPATE